MKTNEKAALATIRQRLIYLLTGEGAPSTAKPFVASAIAELDKTVDDLIAKQTWEPGNPEHGNITGKPISHAQFTIFTHYLGHTRRLFVAWRCPFSRHYKNAKVLERAIVGLRFGERYVRPDKPRDGSWYMWDIGFASSLCVQLMLAGDSLPADLRQAIIEDLGAMPSKVFSLDRLKGITRPPVTSGSNNLDILHTGFLRGLAFDDPQWLTTVMTQVPIAMGPNAGGEGVQPDWSYHFHGHGVNTGYGTGCLASQAEWLYLTQGTPWQLPDSLREVHMNMISEFFARNMWRGRQVPYSTDRGITAPGAIYGRGFLGIMLFGLLTDLPAKDKAVISAATADYLKSLTPDGKLAIHTDTEQGNEANILPALLLASVPQPVQGDISILNGFRYYPHSSFALLRQPNWFAAARMPAAKNKTWNSMLGAHIKGSSGAEFSIAFMTDGREFDHTTIPTMNWKRLMGVTRCDAIEQPPESYGQSTFCSGLAPLGAGRAGDEFAVMGLQYLLAPAGQETLRANKSLFATPDALVLLGSMIRCDSAEPVVTTLFHSPLIDGEPLAGEKDGIRELKAGATVKIRNVTIRLLTDAQLIIETRKGAHNELNMPARAPTDPEKITAWSKVYERRWVYLVVNHGVRPTNGRYGAIISPGKPADLKIVHEDGHHRVATPDASTGGEVRFPGDWRKPIGSSYWGAEQHQWGSIARWTPSDAPSHANLEITPPARFVIGSENANTEIFLPDGLEVENVTLKTYEGRPFPANLLSLPAKGQVLKLRVRRTTKLQK